MSVIKLVGMTVDGHELSYELPNKKTIFVQGKLREHFLYVVESLLARDMTGYYGELDRQVGKVYKELEGEFCLLFNDGAIQAMDKAVQVTGMVPSTHVIRYNGVGSTFRSFYLEQGLSTYSTVYTDMRNYSHVIDDAKWIRLIATVNDLLGFEFVKVVDGKLEFSPSDTCPISPDGQKFVYMLMAECYLTPSDIYRRILLLSDIPYLDTPTQVKFIHRLGVIPGLSLILSTAKVGFADIQSESSMTFLSV